VSQQKRIHYDLLFPLACLSAKQTIPEASRKGFKAVCAPLKGSNSLLYRLLQEGGREAEWLERRNP
jgi:hypothetical protein